MPPPPPQIPLRRSNRIKGLPAESCTPNLTSNSSESPFHGFDMEQMGDETIVSPPPQWRDGDDGDETANEESDNDSYNRRTRQSEFAERWVTSSHAHAGADEHVPARRMEHRAVAAQLAVESAFNADRQAAANLLTSILSRAQARADEQTESLTVAPSAHTHAFDDESVRIPVAVHQPEDIYPAGDNNEVMRSSQSRNVNNAFMRNDDDDEGIRERNRGGRFAHTVSNERTPASMNWCSPTATDAHRKRQLDLSTHAGERNKTFGVGRRLPPVATQLDTDDESDYFDCYSNTTTNSTRQSSMMHAKSEHSFGAPNRQRFDTHTDDTMPELCRMMADLNRQLEEERRLRQADRRERDQLKQSLEDMQRRMQMNDYGQGECTVSRALQRDGTHRASTWRADTISALPATSHGNQTHVDHARNVHEPSAACSKWRASTTSALPATIHAFPNPSQPSRPLVSNEFRHEYRKLLDLPVFDGTPENWPMFKATFINTTEAYGYNDTENLTRLQKSLRGEALEAVASFMIHPNHVTDAMETLEDTFGDPDLLIESQIERARRLQPLHESQMSQLMPFANVVRNVATYLDTPDTQHQLMNPDLLRELVSKLPPSRQFDWAQEASRIHPYVTITHFSRWLSSVAKVAKFIAPSPIQSKHPTKSNGTTFRGTNKTQPQQQKRVMLNDTQSTPCSLCANSHNINDCPDFAKLPWDGRWVVVKERQLCFGCLNSGHILPSCPDRIVCGVDGCRKRHNAKLHETRPNDSNDNKEIANDEPAARVCTTREGPAESTLLYRIVPVTLHSNGRSLRSFALLDEGSSVTLMDETLADELSLKGPTSDLSMRWFGKQATVVKSRKISVGICGEGCSETTTMVARTVRNIALPKQSVHPETLYANNPHLRNVPLARYSDAVPRILIGLDNHRLSRPLDLVSSDDDDSLSAVRTQLGWVVYGSQGPKYLPNAMVLLVDGQHDAEYELLNEIVRSYIASEDFGVRVPRTLIESDDNIRAREIMERTTRRIGNRFETGLLWRSDNAQLPNSYNMALRRLHSVEAKMRREPEMALQYSEQMDAYVAKGYARKLNAEDAKQHDDRTWYLPHFSVRNPNKPGKFRLVFDAAAMVGTVCLNSMLLSGPDENVPLARLLFKFRLGQIGVCADIREMFHQVHIRPEDQNSQRFLWRNGDASKPPDVYVMNVMTFGATCSPALAQHVKNLNAAEHEKEFPDAANAIRSSHYVDDYVASFATPEEAARVSAEVVEIHRRGGFELRGFLSNQPEVLSALGAEPGNGGVVNMESESAVEKILGMSWRTSDDVFCFKTRFSRVPPEVLNGSIRPTKRSILSTSMSVFDPFGLLANFTLPPKLMVQDLYRQGLDWDEPVPDDINERWQAWRQQIERTQLLRVSRCYSPGILTATDLQLHVFADASESAYAAVAFWRLTYAGQVEIAFVCGKAKVAPNTLLSIPRLELNAALLATRLLDEIRRSHELNITKVVMWSDSETVLSWIRSDQRRYKAYVAHRVAEIVDSAPSTYWRWVPTSMNVADEATRVKHPPCFDPENRWIRGPAWLRENEETWPVKKTKEPIHCPEETRSKFVVHIVTDSKSTVDYERFSKFFRLVRTVAWAKRFGSNARANQRASRRTHGELSADEVRSAIVCLCRVVQQEVFTKEYDTLKAGHAVQLGSSIFAFKPYLDKDDLIRVHGRADAADDMYLDSNAKRPILLPRDHRFTRLLVHHHHESLAHQLVEATIAKVRQQYCVPQIRALVRSVLHSCQACKIRSAVPQAPIMGQLPRDRLTPYVRPFTHTGMDYFGPVMVKVGRRREKRWIALFTCLSVRAVHLEIAADLSTNACLICIRNLCNLRGVPSLIRCDNGTNFVGAKNRLETNIAFFDEVAIQKELSTSGICWKMNCPANPEAGGAWERLVQSVKKVLAVTLQEAEPEVETLRAHLIEASNIINSRPLTHVPVDPTEEDPITPNHFLIGGPNISTLPDPEDVRSMCTREQWVQCRELSRRFWLKWVSEYLPELTRRSKHYPERKPLKEDDLVFVCDGSRPRSSWKRGRVIETKVGADGEVRTVRLRTTEGDYWRPVSKLAILDVHRPEDAAMELDEEANED